MEAAVARSSHKSWFLFSLLAAASSWADSCPVLTLETLPKALCADKITPFGTMGSDALYTSSLAGDSSCKKNAASASLRKKLQSVFKGSKEYTGSEISAQKGKALCTYTLPSNWKSALKTDALTVGLTSDIDKRITRGLVQSGLCPELTYEGLTTVQGGGTIEMKKSVLAGGQKFTWHIDQKLKTKTLAFAGKAPDATEKLTGKLEMKKNFIHSCKYVYHPSGKTTEFVLTNDPELKK